MHVKPFLFTLIGLLLFAACRKDSTQQAVVTFNLNGAAKSFDIYTSALSTYDTLGVQQKILTMASPGFIAGPALSSGVLISVEQNLTLPGSGNLNTGAYKDAALDTSCLGSGFNTGCNGFYFRYYDATTGQLNPSTTDSLGGVIITSFSASSNLVSGTFALQLADQNGNLYQVTNGKFTNIPFVNQ